MILWFLNLFPQYRNSLKQLDQQVWEWRVRAELAEADQKKMREELLLTLRRLCNYQALQSGSIQVPFPEVHIDLSKPADDEDTPQSHERKQMREIQKERVANSRRLAAEARQAAINLGRDPLGLDTLVGNDANR